jgi:iron complex outermembrane receptor protein
MQTVRPLAHGRRTVAVNAFYEWTDMASRNAGAKDYGTRGTFSYIDQLEDGKLGLAFGYSNSSRPGQGEQWNAWGYPAPVPASPSVLGGAKPFVRTSELERDGYMGVIEYAPNENFRSTVDLYYSDFREEQLLRGIEIPLWWSSAQLQPGATVSNGLITSGTFKNVYGVVRNTSSRATPTCRPPAGSWSSATRRAGRSTSTPATRASSARTSCSRPDRATPRTRSARRTR